MAMTILVPLDGSALSEQALPYAAVLARATGGRLILMRAVSEIKRGKHEEDEGRIASTLDILAERVRSEGVVAERYIRHVYFEEVGEAIVQAARQKHADLIAMATHGRGGLGRWLYGSVADQVLRLAETPTLLVPAACQQRWPTDRPLRVLVPLDGSDLAEAALEPIAALADQLQAEIILLQVIEPPHYAYAEGYAYVTFDPESERAEAQRYLQGVADRLRAGGRNIQIETVIGYAASAIANAARDLGADLIAMASHGRGGLTRFVLGSVATGTLQRTSVPLLVLRAAALVRPQAAAASAPAPPTQPAPEPAVTLSFTPRELDLIARGLGELLYLPERDPTLAGAVRSLLARVRAAAAGVQPSGSPASR